MTALPESEAATSFVLNALFSNRRLIASATAAASIIAPSTMLSGGTGSIANAMTLYPLPAALSSTALTALEPMSRPTTDFDLPRPNTIVSWLKRVRSSAKRIPNLVRTRACQKPAAIAEICDRSRAFGRAPDYSFVARSQIWVGAAAESFIGANWLAHEWTRVTVGWLDSAQKGSYDLGLPLPGPARQRLSVRAGNPLHRL